MLENARSQLKLFDFSNFNVEKKNIYMHAMRSQKFLPILAKSWHCYKFIKRIFFLSQSNHVQLTGKLKVFCKMNLKSKPVLVESFPSSYKNDLETRNEELNDRLKEFDYYERLLDSEVYSDVTLVVEEKKIYVHKAILACRSPVFEMMLQRCAKDKQEITVEVTGIKYEIMKELLRFMYTGKVNKIDQQAADLLIAADKSSIPGLKILCEKALHKSLSIDNALEYLTLTAICDTTMLKAHVIEFVVLNLKDIVKKQEFELFGALNSKVICEVVRAIVDKNSK